MNKIIVSMSCIVLLAFVAMAMSDEADELRAKAKAMQHEADQLSKKGQKEEAEKLSRAAKELLHSAEKHDPKSSPSKSREVDELHQRLKALIAKENVFKESGDEEGLAELKKHRAAIERELAERKKPQDRHPEKKPGAKLNGKHPAKDPETLHDAARRIKHVQIAAENLHAAGMHDLADELIERVQNMERELHQAHAGHEKPQPKRGQSERDDDDGEEALNSAVKQLRHEVQRLRAELEELRHGLRKRDRDDD